MSDSSLEPSYGRSRTRSNSSALEFEVFKEPDSFVSELEPLEVSDPSVLKSEMV